jgi:hypothetical protein
MQFKIQLVFQRVLQVKQVNLNNKVNKLKITFSNRIKQAGMAGIRQLIEILKIKKQAQKKKLHQSLHQ